MVLGSKVDDHSNGTVAMGTYHKDTNKRWCMNYAHESDGELGSGKLISWGSKYKRVVIKSQINNFVSLVWPSIFKLSNFVFFCWNP